MGSQFVPSDFTVLIVDSDQRMCAELSTLLERAGYRTRTFHSGEALLQVIDTAAANVCVIAEVELPGMTGLELISRLRQENIEAPVIILTRLSDVATAVRAMRDNVSDYLVKPYVERDLINRLRTALLKQQAALH
jgi:FixJ family two-component response regulator